jgi:hypothetical protein
MFVEHQVPEFLGDCVHAHPKFQLGGLHRDFFEVLHASVTARVAPVFSLSRRSTCDTPLAREYSPQPCSGLALRRKTG